MPLVTWDLDLGKSPWALGLSTAPPHHTPSPYEWPMIQQNLNKGHRCFDKRSDNPSDPCPCQTKQSLNLASPHLPTQLETLEAAHPNSQQILQKQSRAFSELKNPATWDNKTRDYKMFTIFLESFFWALEPTKPYLIIGPTGHIQPIGLYLIPIY